MARHRATLDLYASTQQIRADRLYGDAGNDYVYLQSDITGADTAWLGAGSDYASLSGRGNVVLGEGGLDRFSAHDGSTSTITGGSEADTLSVGNYGYNNNATYVTWTDYVQDQDHLELNGYNARTGSYYYSTAAFIDLFDVNQDNALSRADGTSVSNGSDESFSFSTNSAGVRVLTINFDDAHVTLQGADYLI